MNIGTYQYRVHIRYDTSPFLEYRDEDGSKILNNANFERSSSLSLKFT
jgi:hypothetical protein